METVLIEAHMGHASRAVNNLPLPIRHQPNPFKPDPPLHLSIIRSAGRARVAA